MTKHLKQIYLLIKLAISIYVAQQSFFTSHIGVYHFLFRHNFSFKNRLVLQSVFKLNVTWHFVTNVKFIIFKISTYHMDKVLWDTSYTHEISFTTFLRNTLEKYAFGFGVFQGLTIPLHCNNKHRMARKCRRCKSDQIHFCARLRFVPYKLSSVREHGRLASMSTIFNKINAFRDLPYLSTTIPFFLKPIGVDTYFIIICYLCSPVLLAK